jgi:hypothetical protein
MGADTASTKTNLTDVSAMHTGYRVTAVPGALEVTARLVEPNEVRNLMKVLRAGCIILEETTEGDMDKPLTLSRPAPVSAAPSVKPLTR